MSDKNFLLNIYKLQITETDFKKISRFIYDNYGIKLPETKKTMLQSRLVKRLRELNLPDFKSYTEYLFSKDGQEREVLYMIDEVSTNKTDFFRENAHFVFLNESLLPYFMRKNKTDIKVWSAACSSGEEVYTLAIVMSEFKKLHPGFQFHVMGSDISKKMLAKALTAVYPERLINPVPMPLRKNYFLRSKDRKNPTVRLVKEIRQRTSFQLLNLMDTVYDTRINSFDIVFCRNVLIYFDRPTQEKVIRRLLNKLKPGGFLFLGHSESITNMKLPVKQIKPTIFRKL